MTFTRSAGFLGAVAALLVLPGCVGVLPSDDPPRDWATDGAGLELVHVYGDPKTSGRDEWPESFDNKPTLFDIDGDGVRDVVAHSNDRHVYVFNGRTGETMARIATSYPPGWHVERVLNPVAVARLAPDAPPSLVISNPAAVVSVWTFDAARSDEHAFAFDRAWELRLNNCEPNSGLDAGPVLADLTGDGAKEILLQTEELGLYALRADGTGLWAHCWGGGNADAVASDLDGDGNLEAIFASDAGLLSVFDGATGRTLWTFSAQDEGVLPGSVAVAPTVAELDGRAPKEVLFTARSADVTDGRSFEDNRFALFAVREPAQGYEGELVWMQQPRWGNPLVHSRLLVQDVDGDGATDVFGLDWNTIGHKPGDWERLGPAHLFRLDDSGNDVWIRPVDAWWSNKDIALADLSRDGTLELLTNGPHGEGDGLWRVSAANGASDSRLSLGSWKMLRGPQVIEDDGGSPQVAFPVETERGHSAILLYEASAQDPPPSMVRK